MGGIGHLLQKAISLRLENKIKTYTREAVEVSCGPGAGADAEPLCRSRGLGTGFEEGP